MRKIAAALAMTVILLSAFARTAETAAVRDQILSRAAYFESSACQILKVEFNLPIRYVSHYPFESGTELRIELDLLVTNVEDAQFERRREALEPPRESDELLAAIVYEGNTVPRPILTLTFRRQVSFKVAQGDDFRSVVVAVPRPSGSGVCAPVFPDSE
jgi:hypothetical protein